jgi:hypothetical protein
MLAALSALTVMAAAAPKVVYQPSPAAASDVGTVALLPSIDKSCFEAVLVQLMASSRKSDRARSNYLSVTLAAASGAPSQITGATWGDGKALKLVNLRTGDVACHDYVCPTGSTGIFSLDDEAEAAARAGSLAVKVVSTIGSACTLSLAVPVAPVEALDRWADGLPKPK